MRRLKQALDPLTKRVATDGPEDERWYWAAPLLLDRRRDREGSERWLAGSTAFRGLSQGAGADDEDSSAWALHVDLAQRMLRDGMGHSNATADLTDARALGRVPADLLETLARLAIAGPGVCGLRAMARVLARVRGGSRTFGPAMRATPVGGWRGGCAHCSTSRR